MENGIMLSAVTFVLLLVLGVWAIHVVPTMLQPFFQLFALLG